MQKQKQKQKTEFLRHRLHITCICSSHMYGMDMWNAPTMQSRQPLTYRLMESVGLGGPRWLGSSWQWGIAECGSSQLSTLMIETPGDLVWDLPCVQQASCLEGGPMLWIWPLYLHVNKKSDDDDDDDTTMGGFLVYKCLYGSFKYAINLYVFL